MNPVLAAAVKRPESKKARAIRKAEAIEPTSDPYADVLHLQHMAGNRAIGLSLGARGLLPIQPKLIVSSPRDHYEQEADRVAEQVMRMPVQTLNRQTEITPLSGDHAQRDCEDCEEKLEERIEQRQATSIQRKSLASTPPEVPPETESRLKTIRQGGQQLPGSVRNFFEPRLKSDFSSVRIHTNVSAAMTAKSLGAHAFTVGKDIVFAPGQYAPETRQGKRLLAHELTHVVQQHGGTPSIPKAAPHSILGIKNGRLTGLQRSLAPQISSLTGRQAVTVQRQPATDANNFADLTDEQLVERIKIMGEAAGTSDPEGDSRNLFQGILRSLLEERARRIKQRQRLYPTMAELLARWQSAGLLDPPYRPNDVPEIPPIRVKEEEKRSIEAGLAAGGLAAVPALAPAPAPTPTPTPPTGPSLRVLPGGGAAPVEGPAPVPRGVPVAVPILVGLAVFLYPRETAPRWADELNPISGGPYHGPEEYDWTWRLRPVQRDFLRRLSDAKRQSPDPSLEDEPDPSDFPVPQPQPRTRKKDDDEKNCFSTDIPRRGGNKRHDAYATKVSGSISDYYVRTPERQANSYDGIRFGTPEVWEVKVGHGWFFNPDYTSLRDLKLAEWDAQKNRGLTVAARCGYTHLWSIPDRWVAGLLNARWGGIPPVLNIPEK